MFAEPYNIDQADRNLGDNSCLDILHNVGHANDAEAVAVISVGAYVACEDLIGSEVEGVHVPRNIFTPELILEAAVYMWTMCVPANTAIDTSFIQTWADHIVRVAWLTHYEKNQD